MKSARDMRTVFATASVLAWRLPMLWAMGIESTPRRRAEALRMVAEKQAALAEGMVRANLTASQEAMALWSKGLFGTLKSKDVKAAANRIARAGHAPAIRSVKANARRLKSRKI